MNAKQNFFSGQINDLANHTIEATVSILGFNNSTVRNHLIKELDIHAQSEKNMDSLIGTPVFDVLFPWQGQDKTPEQLGDLLHPKIISAIQKPYKHQLQAWQLLSSNHNKPNSLVVTSGTGSGKTECFMIPIIDSLVRDQQKTRQPLQGVQALFLYPLNALINSQKDRLDQWTTDFGENIRFCLYNGLTPESHAQEHKKNANQVQSREILRDSPPPILVTNATMLEYMLIRQKDQAIIEKSQGKLRWVVLDEAHSYLGSTASELSLLLRRVMIAFGVDAKDVHFIATSATIGEDDEAKRKLVEFLSALSGTPRDNIHVITAQRHVPVIEGFSPTIDTNTHTLAQITAIEPSESVSLTRYQALSKHPFANNIRNQFIQHDGKTSPRSLDELLANLSSQINAMLKLEKANHTQFEQITARDYLLRWLDIASYTKPSTLDEEPAFLPLRAHLFQRTLTGLYACSNSDCIGKHSPHSNLDQQTNGSPDWSFGYIYGNTRQNCEYCESPVYELVFCQDCQTPHLLAMDDPKHIGNLKLKHFSRIKKDEFALDDVIDDESGTTQAEPSNLDKGHQPILLMPPFFTKQLNSRKMLDNEESTSFSEMFLSKDGVVFPTQHAASIPVFLHQSNEDGVSTLKHCCFCNASSEKQAVLKASNLGAPFYMSEAAPKILDYCEPFNKAKNSVPYHGKRMITFTDSRQGTARITMKLRQDSERRALRHIVYNYLAQRAEASKRSDKETQKIKNDIVALDESLASMKNIPGMEVTIKILQEQIEERKQQLAATASDPLISWQDMLTNIKKDNEFSFLKESMARIAEINKITDATEIAELLLLNELARRPRNANSLETMGLVYLSYPQLQKAQLTGEELKIWQDLGFQLEDWQDFLKLLMDFYIRENKYVNLSFEQINSVSDRYFGKLELVPPDTNLDFNAHDNKYIRPWLQVNNTSPNRSQRLIKLLALPKGINLADEVNKDKLNLLLKKAWEQLVTARLLTRSTRQDFSTYQFDFRNASLTIPSKVYICPVSHHLLDTTLKGFTPYLPLKQNLLQLIAHRAQYECELVEIPIFKPDPLQVNYTKQANTWLKAQPVIQHLRKSNLWTDISDSVIAGMNTIVTEEHSAQIKQKSLEKYEQRFKNGEINILNCSTTMEMGVDIGGISAVAMNNVPPHPANYLQRTGRAGRRGESQAIAFTICKNNPHEQMVFSHTRWAFDTKIKPPYITLNSQKIIQRHINAYLLGLFLTQESTHQVSNITLKSGWFFLNWIPENIDKSYLDAIVNNLPDDETEKPWHRLFTKNAPYLTMQNWLKKLLLQDSQSSEKNRISKHVRAIISQSAFSSLPIENFIQASIDSLNSMKRYSIEKTIAKLQEFKQIKSSRHTQTGYLNKLTIDIKGIANAYLLADLAKFGFLPRYGFPSGVVEFDIYNSINFKDTRYSNRDETQNFTNGKPTRDLAVALREYAPGNEVAVDGLVYKSAGLELSQYLNYSQNNDAQILRYFGQCQSCGAIDYDVDENQPNCKVCHTKIRNLVKFVEPMGFKVDYVAKPHTKIENPTYVPVQEPKIQANTELLPLPNPQLGSYRVDSEGRIFHYSSGTYGHGYFICLHCGRAESTMYDKVTQPSGFENQQTAFMKYHIPMKPLKELKELKEANADDARGACSNSGFKVHHMHIGATDTTNIFELYLKNPTTQQYFEDSDESKVLLTTLSVVLRDALAQCHGINADELGCGIKPLRMNGEDVNTIFIYDKAGGGAGFSSVANKYFSEIFVKAKALLDCPDNCETACHSCLIDYDTRFISDQLDRNMAKAYFTAIEPMLTLPDEARIINGAQYCTTTIAERVAEGLNHEFDKITLFLQGNPKEWTLSASLREKISLWQNSGKQIELSITKSMLEQMETIDKEYLASLPRVWHTVTLSTWAETGEYLSNNALLQLSKKTDDGIKTLSIATTNKNAYVPNENFWHIDDTAFVVESFAVPPVGTQYLSIDQHSQPGDYNPNNALFTEVTNQLNVPINQFAQAFWDLLQVKQSKLHINIEKGLEIKLIEYSDKYIYSPLIILLLGEVVSRLKQLTNSMPQLTIKTTVTDEDRPSEFLDQKWNNERAQSGVIEAYMKFAGFDQTERYICRIHDSSKLSHHRSLTICWSDDSQTKIYLDHGFGFLKYDVKDNESIRSRVNKIKFPFNDSIATQVNELNRLSQRAISLINKEPSTLITMVQC